MTTPDPGQRPHVHVEAEPLAEEPQENPVFGWARAIGFGIGDTAKNMLAEGRRGAREAMEHGWDRFDEKTKHRRK